MFYELTRPWVVELASTTTISLSGVSGGGRSEIMPEVGIRYRVGSTPEERESPASEVRSSKRRC